MPERTLTTGIAACAWVLAAAAGQAQVACPTAGDMGKGVRFQVSGGESETFRRMENGIVEAYFQLATGEQVRTLLGKGIYLLEVVDFENGGPVAGTRTTYSFPLSPQDLPEPDPGGGWAVSVAKLENGSISREAQSYRFGQEARQVYGVCGYRMIPIDIRYPDEKDPSRRDVLHYLPELGLSYLAEYHDRDASDIYTYFHVEATR